MPVSDAKKAANKRWNDKNYTQVKLSMPNQEAEDLAAYCAAKNISKAGFIRTLIKDAIQNDAEYQVMQKTEE